MNRFLDTFLSLLLMCLPVCCLVGLAVWGVPTWPV